MKLQDIMKYSSEILLILDAFVLAFNYNHLSWKEKKFGINLPGLSIEELEPSEYFITIVIIIVFVILITFIYNQYASDLSEEFSYGYRANKGVKDWFCKQYSWLSGSTQTLGKVMSSVQGNFILKTQYLGKFKESFDDPLREVNFEPDLITHCCAVYSGVLRILNLKFCYRIYAPLLLTAWALLTIPL